MILLWIISLQAHAVTVQHTPVYMTINSNQLSVNRNANISSKSGRDQTSLLQDERSLLVKRESRQLSSSKKDKKGTKKKKASPLDCFDIGKMYIAKKDSKTSTDDDEYLCVQYPFFLSKKKCCRYCPLKNPFFPADKCKTKNPELAGGATIQYFATSDSGGTCASTKLIVTFEINDLDEGASMTVGTWNEDASPPASSMAKCYPITVKQGPLAAVTGITGGNPETELPKAVDVQCDQWGTQKLNFWKTTACTGAENLIFTDLSLFDVPASTTCHTLNPPFQFANGGAAEDGLATYVKKNFVSVVCGATDAKIEWFVEDTLCDTDPFWYVRVKKNAATPWVQSAAAISVKSSTTAQCYNMFTPPADADPLTYAATGIGTHLVGSLDPAEVSAIPGGGAAAAPATSAGYLNSVGGDVATGAGGITVSSLSGTPGTGDSIGASFQCSCTTADDADAARSMRCQLYSSEDCTGDTPAIDWSSNSGVLANFGWCDKATVPNCYGVAGAATAGQCQIMGGADVPGSWLKTGLPGGPGYPMTFVVGSTTVADAKVVLDPGGPQSTLYGITTKAFRKTFKTGSCTR